MKPVVFTAAADADVTRAVAFYEGQQEGLGARFVAEVDQTVERISQHPLGYACVIDKVRRANIRRFPFALWFRVIEDGSVVIACLDSRRNPVLARERAKGVWEMPKPPEP